MGVVRQTDGEDEAAFAVEDLSGMGATMKEGPLTPTSVRQESAVDAGEGGADGQSGKKYPAGKELKPPIDPAVDKMLHILLECLKTVMQMQGRTVMRPRYKSLPQNIVDETIRAIVIHFERLVEGNPPDAIDEEQLYDEISIEIRERFRDVLAQFIGANTVVES